MKSPPSSAQEQIAYRKWYPEDKEEYLIGAGDGIAPDFSIDNAKHACQDCLAETEGHFDRGLWVQSQIYSVDEDNQINAQSQGQSLRGCLIARHMGLQ